MKAQKLFALVFSLVLIPSFFLSRPSQAVENARAKQSRHPRELSKSEQDKHMYLEGVEARIKNLDRAFIVMSQKLPHEAPTKRDHLQDELQDLRKAEAEVRSRFYELKGAAPTEWKDVRDTVEKKMSALEDQMTDVLNDLTEKS